MSHATYICFESVLSRRRTDRELRGARQLRHPRPPWKRWRRVHNYDETNDAIYKGTDLSALLTSLVSDIGDSNAHVHFRTGIYRHNSTVNWDTRNLRITGSGRNKTFIYDASDLTGPIWKVNPTSTINILDIDQMKIEGVAGRSAGKGVEINNVGETHLKNVELRSHPDINLHLNGDSGSEWNVVEDLLIVEPHGTVIVFEDASRTLSDYQFIGGKIKGPRDDAIDGYGIHVRDRTDNINFNGTVFKSKNPRIDNCVTATFSGVSTKQNVFGDYCIGIDPDGTGSAHDISLGGGSNFYTSEDLIAWIELGDSFSSNLGDCKFDGDRPPVVNNGGLAGISGQLPPSRSPPSISGGTLVPYSAAMDVNGEGGAADTLEAIDHDMWGCEVALGYNGEEITVAHETGNIQLAGVADKTLSGGHDVLKLKNYGTGWYEIGGTV